MKDDIAVLYETMWKSNSSLLVEIEGADTHTTDGQSENDSVQVINIYIKPANGPIQKPYSGDIVNSTRLEDSYTYIARDVGSDKTIQVTMLDEGDISVNVQDSDGRIQDTFLGKNLDFYDIDEDQRELNIIKIETV